MKIEQVLHGYNNGHTILQASSRSLTANDMARMDILSDWTGYQDGRDDSSYITGYPLKDSPCYVVAKSWYAYEMERPGCVWTHSLLLNLDDIDKNFDFRLLLTYFKRPVKNEYKEYSVSIEVTHFPTINGDRNIIPIDEVSLLFVYSSLFVYEKPFSFNIEMTALDNQKFCLSLLQFMPLQMLKHLSLSSGSNSLRQVDGELLTLQFIQDSNLMSLLSPPWKDKIKIDDFPNGARFLLQEALDGRNSIAPLIRIFSNDIGTSYQKLCTIGYLLYILNRAINKKVASDDYHKVLDIITSEFPNEDGALVKSNFLGDTISQYFCPNEDFLYYISICNNAQSLPEKFVNLLSHLERLDDDEAKVLLLEKIANFDHYNKYGKAILGYIFHSLDWKNIDRQQFRILLEILEKKYDEEWQEQILWSSLWSMCLRNNVDVSRPFAHLMRKNIVQPEIMVFDFLNSNLVMPKNIAHCCFENMEVLLVWLEDKITISELLVEYILEDVNPNDVSIQKHGTKSWAWLVGYKGKKSLAFYAFVFSLSFNWTNSNALELLKLSFYPIHEILRYDIVKAPILWKMVMRYADELPIKESWDNCKKLRKGIVRYLKKCGYKKFVLENFTPDGQVNKWLCELW